MKTIIAGVKYAQEGIGSQLANQKSASKLGTPKVSDFSVVTSGNKKCSPTTVSKMNYKHRLFTSQKTSSSIISRQIDIKDSGNKTAQKMINTRIQPSTRSLYADM